MAAGVGAVCWLFFVLASESVDSRIVGGLAVLLGAWAVIRRKERYLCTDMECATPIPLEATVCPGCGGQVGGRIRSKREIFANEE